MIIRFRSSSIFAAVALVSSIGCSSSDLEPEPSPEKKFSDALTTAYEKCSTGAKSACSTAMSKDGTKLASLLSPSVLDGATTCVKATACGTEPLTCLGKALGAAKPSAAQAALATAYCKSCSSVGGEACTTAFFGTGDVPGAAFVLLPFGDAPLEAVTDACTKNPLGKTACQAAFTTCLSATTTKFLATTISVDSAKCLLEGIRPPE